MTARSEPRTEGGKAREERRVCGGFEEEFSA